MLGMNSDGAFECHACGVGLTGFGGGPSGEAVSLRLLLEHQLAAGLDAVVFFGLGDVTQGAGSPWQRSVQTGSVGSRTGHAQKTWQAL